MDDQVRNRYFRFHPNSPKSGDVQTVIDYEAEFKRFISKSVFQKVFCTPPVQPTMKLLELSGVQGGDGVRHAGSFADSVRVHGPHSKVVGVSFEQPGHWVFTDLNGVIVALDPVVSSDLTSVKNLHRKRAERKVL